MRPLIHPRQSGCPIVRSCRHEGEPQPTPTIVIQIRSTDQASTDTKVDRGLACRWEGQRARRRRSSNFAGRCQWTPGSSGPHQWPSCRVHVRWLQPGVSLEGCRCFGTCRLGGESCSAHRGLFGAAAKSPQQLPQLRWPLVFEGDGTKVAVFSPRGKAIGF
jgi:hypothetical protein